MKKQGPVAGDQGAGSFIRSLCLTTPDEARKELTKIGVDPAGISRMLTKIEHHTILLPQIRPAAANILKQEMLSLGGDAAVARGTVACSVNATDVLLIGTHKQLSALCDKLAGQPFGLVQLAVELFSVLQKLHQPPQYWQTSRRRLALDRPLIMGILNITPDSFSDGGRFNDLGLAVERAMQMAEEGADLIDIGGESTRPGAPPVTEDEERKRIVPVIEALSGKLAIPVSVDTWKSAVADTSLSAGAEIINDISGFNFDPAMAQVAARHQAGVVLMHTRGTPQQMQQNTSYTDLMFEITKSLVQSAATALAAGTISDRIALDPGIGFGKSTEGNLEILHRVAELKSLGYPLLVGTSRKSFIGTTLKQEKSNDRLFGTAATVALAIAAGVNILRVHDVRAMKEVALMAHAIAYQPT